MDAKSEHNVKLEYKHNMSKCNQQYIKIKLPYNHSLSTCLIMCLVIELALQYLQRHNYHKLYFDLHAKQNMKCKYLCKYLRVGKKILNFYFDQMLATPLKSKLKIPSVVTEEAAVLITLCQLDSKININRKKKFQVRNCTHQIVLWSCLWLMFLIND